MIIDEDDITVGRFLYYLNNKQDGKWFVGIITEITDIGSIDGPQIKVNFPLNPGVSLHFSIKQIKEQIENESIVIK